MMAVKTLGYFLDRLKLTLSNDACCICQSAQPMMPTLLVCLACEKKILLRQSVPVLTFSPGPLYAACEFPYRMKQMLYGLKFDRKTEHSLVIAEILIHYWQKLPQSQSKGWVVVPVPSHAEKTFAHVPQFARPFASQFGYDFMEDGLVWQRPVVSQHTLLNKRKRRENIAGAFQVNPKLIKRYKAGTKILLVDDLLTTGSTLMEASSTIYRAGLEYQPTALAVSHVPLAVRRFQTNDEY